MINGHGFRCVWLAIISGVLGVAVTHLACGAEIDLTSAQLTREEVTAFGLRIWDNESNRRRDGLTSWNDGEQFASLGIGHFIWYPAGVEGPFEESFPALLEFLRERAVPIPDWLTTIDMDCPWRTRHEFSAQFDSPEMIQLRELLATTVGEQSRFMANRLRNALPKILSEAPPDRRRWIRAQFEKLAASAHGLFALIDYVNFKGEGTKATERYQGQGWGLLQVLDGMTDNAYASAVDDFIRSATEVLQRRVNNSPPARDEKRWLAGWLKRVSGYRDTL